MVKKLLLAGAKTEPTDRVKKTAATYPPLPTLACLVCLRFLGRMSP